ncbi:MAG: putative manganese transporter [Eubacterium sp.]|nr:putative manganese transporter [Eubacterium sp.]
MWDMIMDVLVDAGMDTLKLIPFLFLTYLLMEWFEHKMEVKSQSAVLKAGRLGPLVGGLVGVAPQCGFSAAASSLYAGGMITAGTLIAVFLSTSDEMLPIFISEQVPVATMLWILGTKAVMGIVFGFLLDLIYHGVMKRPLRYKNLIGAHAVHEVCEGEHCHCEEGSIFKSAVIHTLQITLFIFIFGVVIGGIVEGVGEETISGFFSGVPVIGELIAGVVGLIPNCAASVVITELYLEGVIGAGPMITGLLVSAGVGLLVLFRLNRRHIKQNLALVGYLYLVGVALGTVVELIGVRF